MPKNIKITHNNDIETLTGTINTLVEHIQQDGISPLDRGFKEDHISEIKINNNKDEMSPGLKKTINLLKTLIIEIEMVNQNTNRELWAARKSINNPKDSKCNVADDTNLFCLNEPVATACTEINVNSQIKEFKAMVDQFSSSYFAKRHSSGVL
jgi:hypothetical protein